jgi:hypothetical protein
MVAAQGLGCCERGDDVRQWYEMCMAVLYGLSGLYRTRGAKVCCLAWVRRVCELFEAASDPADPPRPHLPNSVESNMTYAAQQPTGHF